MDRILVAVDASVGVGAEEFAAAWARVPEAVRVGSAEVESVPEGSFLPGVAELVVVPVVVVNLASAVLYDLVRRVLAKVDRRGWEVVEVEVVEFTSAGGDRVVVARARREVS